jgi:hypothetical protein
MAVQRIVATWMGLQAVESMCAQAQGKFEQARFWLRRQEQAHELYAAAIKSYALIREMLPPAAEHSVAAGASENGMASPEHSRETAGRNGHANRSDLRKKRKGGAKANLAAKSTAGNGFGRNRIAAMAGEALGAENHSPSALPTAKHHNGVNRIASLVTLPG